MRLPEKLPSVSEHEILLRNLLSDPGCFIVLDTNTLTWTYRLGRGARDTFVSWLAELATNNRLVIPAWVAFEYHRHQVANKHSVFRPSSDAVDTFDESARQLLKFAFLLADDNGVKACGYNSRQEFLTKIQSAVSDSRKLASHVKKMNESEEKTDTPLRELLARTTLSSNIHLLLQRCEREATLRQRHSLGPATKDAGKVENPHGDLVIWFEILQHSQEHANRSYLLITNDVKTDWNFAPSRIRNTSGREVPNAPSPDGRRHYILRPDLTHEFRSTTGNEQIQILDTAWLSELLHQSDNAKYKSLAFAIQDLDVPSGGDATPPATGDKPPMERASSKSGVEVRKPEPLSLSSFALADKNFSLADSPLGELIRLLRTHSWASQNRAISLFEETNVRSGSHDEFFVLGRNIYQAACGSSHKAIDFINRLPASLSGYPPDGANCVAAGMMYEIYFGGWNNLRDIPQTFMLDEVANLYLEESRYKRAFSFLAAKVAEASKAKSMPFLATFDSPEPRVLLELEIRKDGDSSKPTLTFVRQDNRTLLHSSAKEQTMPGYSLSVLEGLVSVDDIREAIALEFFTPERFIKPNSQGHEKVLLNTYTYMVKLPDQGSAALLVDVPALAGKSRLELEATLGPVVKVENVAPSGISTSPKLYFKEEDVEVVFIADRSDWITISSLGSLPYEAASIVHLGFAPSPPSTSNENSIRWKDLQGFLEVALFPGRPGYCSYLLAKHSTP